MTPWSSRTRSTMSPIHCMTKCLLTIQGKCMMVYHPSLKPLSYIGILSHLGVPLPSTSTLVYRPGFQTTNPHTQIASKYKALSTEHIIQDPLPYAQSTQLNNTSSLQMTPTSLLSRIPARQPTCPQDLSFQVRWTRPSSLCTCHPLRSTTEIKNVQGRLSNDIPANPWLTHQPRKAQTKGA